MSKIKLQSHHIEWIRDFWLQNNDRKITWEMIRIELHKRFNEITKLSLSTIARCLKTKLNMSFKRLESKPFVSFSHENVRRLCESAWIQSKLDEAEIEMIYLDEFKLSSKHCKFRGCAPSSSKGFIKSYSDDFHASFIVALSHKQIYGIMASEITFNAEMFMKFVKDLLIRRNEKAENKKWKFVLVFDNNSIHVSNKTKQRFWSTRVPCITIAPYWPCLNPCEKFIGAIK